MSEPLRDKPICREDACPLRGDAQRIQDAVRKFLYLMDGNGREGLPTRLHDLERWQEIHDERLKEERSMNEAIARELRHKRWEAWVAIGSAILEVVLGILLTALLLKG